jgi:hypothetical protein
VRTSTHNSRSLFVRSPDGFVAEPKRNGRCEWPPTGGKPYASYSLGGGICGAEVSGPPWDNGGYGHGFGRQGRRKGFPVCECCMNNGMEA